MPNVEAGSKWTASVWYKNTGDQVGGTSQILSQIYAGSTGINLSIGNNDLFTISENKVNGGFYNNSTETWYYGSTIQLVNGQWTNIQVTWDGTSMKTYIDSTLLGTTTPGGTSTDNGLDFCIGRRFDSDNYMTGEIGEVRIYKYAINQAKVTADYNESLATFPPPAPAILLLKAVNYSGTGTWNDESGNSTNATKETGTIAKNTAGNGIVLDDTTTWTFANLALGNAWTVNTWYKYTGVNTGAFPIIVGQKINNDGNTNLRICDATNTDSFKLQSGKTNGDPFAGSMGSDVAWNGSYWVAVGSNSGQTQCIAKSTDGLSWTTSTDNPFTGGVGKDIAWNDIDEYWVAVGSGTGCIAKSTDGLSWTTSTNNPFAGSGGQGNGIAWNGTYWLAVGNDPTGTQCIAKSTDGLSWTYSTNNPFTAGSGLDVAWNGTYWVAVGFNTGFTQCIAKSTDGLTWTVSTNNPFPGGQGIGQGVAWNGSYWIMIGYNIGGQTQCIAKSTDGLSWYASTNNPFTIGLGIAWNGTYWLAGGYNGDNTQSIAKSTDGLSWTVSNNNPFTSANGCQGIAWNNSYWLAVGQGIQSIVKSTDGLNWTTTLIEGSPFSLTLDTWTNIQTTWDGTSLITYIDGTLTSTNTLSATMIDYSTPYAIGPGLGEIGEIRIYDYAIDQTKVTADYNESLSTYPIPELLVSLKAVNYSGTGTWNDESGNSINATLEDGTIAKNADGNGIVLDGSTSWTFPNVAAGAQWTASVWYKNTGDQTNSPAAILTQILSNSKVNLMIGNYSWSITDNRVSGAFMNGSWSIGSSTLLVNGQWTNIQVTWDGTIMKTYINSTLVTSDSTGGASIDAGTAYVIGRRFDDTSYMTGEIGEVRIYNYVIDQTKVTADYNESLSTFPNPLVLLRAVNYSGTGTWSDESGNSTNATNEAGTIAKNADGNGIVLDGSTSWTFNNVALGNAWSVNVWYKNNSLIGYGGIITQKGGVAHCNLLIANVGNFLADSNQVSGTFLDSNIGQWFSGSAIQLINGLWVNIQITWNGTNMITYVNGTLLGTTTPGGTSINNGLNYSIGASPDGNFVTGEIGEVRIYDFAINQAKVTADYNESLATFPNPLVLLKAINYSGSGTWNDESGNSKNATKENGTIAKNSDGNGIVLNGSTSWTFPNVAAGAQWTASVWYKNTGNQVGGPSSILTQIYDGSTGLNLSIGNNDLFTVSENKVNGGFNTGGWFYGSTIQLVNGQWTNIQVTWDGTSMRTYINSTLLGTTTPGGTSADNGLSYRIGPRGSEAYYMTGEIGEVRIYNYAINQAKVTADYNESYATFPNPLVLLKAINYSGSGTWNDESGNSKNATKEAGTIAKNTAGNGIVLDGSTSWTFPNVAAGSQWTINVWYKNTMVTNGITNASGLVNQLWSDGNINIAIGSVEGNETNLGFRTSSGNWYIGGDFTSYFTPNNWVNLIGTWNGTNLTTYVNGTQIESITPGGTSVDNGSAYRIGRRWDGSNYVTGEIGEIRIYNLAINQTKVTADYNESAATF